MENKEILKELRSIMGLNRREFAEYFCIPLQDSAGMGTCTSEYAGLSVKIDVV